MYYDFLYRAASLSFMVYGNCLRSFTMEYLSSRTVFFVAFWIFTAPVALAHFCEWGLCESWEYCCAHNECCNATDFNKLLLILAVFGTLLMAILCCVWFYCRSQRPSLSLLYKIREKVYHVMRDSRNIQGGPNFVTIDRTCEVESMNNNYIIRTNRTTTSG